MNRTMPLTATLALLSLPGPAPAQLVTPDAAALGRIVPVPRPERGGAPRVAPGAEAAEGLTELAARLFAEDEPLTEAEVLIEAVLQPRTGGLDRIRDRGFLRMAVAPDPLMIAFDGERALGVAMEIARELELYMGSQPDAGRTPTVVVPTPMPRREVPDSVSDGLTDFATLTVSTARQDPGLDYTQPLIREVTDVPILGPALAEVDGLDDLQGVPVYLAEGSRYVANAQALNAEREAAGLPLLDLRFVDGRLDDYDLIEMVEVGLIPATIATDFKGRFWSSVYPSISVREDLPLSEPARIAWTMRSDNPDLQALLDGFAETIKQGTMLGNTVLQRFAASADWIEDLGTDEARVRIDEVGPVIARWAEHYAFDADLLLAQAYQESRLDQGARSHVGAIGVMQVMPATAADPVVGIPDVSTVEANVEAGIKYMRWLRDTFFDDPAIAPLDQTLLSLAAYNAGPGGVRRARRVAAEMGLDPDVWFENVEVAIQQAVSREPAIYVRNIFKYYVSYRLLNDLEAEVEQVREAVVDALPDAGTPVAGGAPSPRTAR
jgi:membrane-bound lytic murein transglycosylase MltF